MLWLWFYKQKHILLQVYILLAITLSFLWQSLSHLHAFDSVEVLSKSPALDCYVVIKAHFRILKTGKLNPDESELFFPQFLANFLLISGNLSRCFFMLHKWQNFRKLFAMFRIYFLDSQN